MNPDPETTFFLDVELVESIHDNQLHLYSSKPLEGLRDRDGLESAVYQCQAGTAEGFFCVDLFEMAASLMFHIQAAQAFVDGNKRTAVAAALAFLELNGVFYAEDAGLFDVCCKVAEKSLGKAELADYFRKLPRAKE